MTNASIIESPDGKHVILNSLRWGTADVSERSAHGTGIEDLWNATQRGSIRGQNARPEAGLLTQPAPVAFSIMELADVMLSVHTGTQHGRNPMAQYAVSAPDMASTAAGKQAIREGMTRGYAASAVQSALQTLISATDSNAKKDGTIPFLQQRAAELLPD